MCTKKWKKSAKRRRPLHEGFCSKNDAQNYWESAEYRGERIIYRGASNESDDMIDNNYQNTEIS